MADVLLVIGSVTDKQFEQARIKMINVGLKPKVVRVDQSEYSRRVHDMMFEHIDDPSSAGHSELGVIALKELIGPENNVCSVVIEHTVWYDTTTLCDITSTFTELGIDERWVCHEDGTLEFV